MYRFLKLFTWFAASILLCGMVQQRASASPDSPVKAHKSKKEASAVMQALKALKHVSGKPDSHADFYVFVILTQQFVFNCDKFPDAVQDELQRGSFVEAMRKIQRKKGVETILLVADDADMTAVKKKAIPLLRIKAPIYIWTLETTPTFSAGCDELVLVDRRVSCLESGYLSLSAGRILEEINRRQDQPIP